MSTIVPAVFSDTPKGFSFGPPASISYDSLPRATEQQMAVRPLTPSEIDQFVNSLSTGMRGISIPAANKPYLVTKWRFWIERTNEKIKASYGTFQEVGSPQPANEFGEILSPTSYFLAHVNVNDPRLQAVEASTAPLGPLRDMDVNTIASALERSGDSQTPFFKSWLFSANALSSVIKGSNPSKTIVPLGNVYTRGPQMLPEMRLQTNEPLYGNMIENFADKGLTTNQMFFALAIISVGYLMFSS